MRQNPLTGHFSIGEPEKKTWCYVSRISPDVPLQPIGTNFGLRVRLVDVIKCNRLRGLDSVRDRSLTIPIGLRCRR